MVSLLAAPAVTVILLLAFKLSTNPRERLANLVFGGVGSVVAALALIFLCTPRPNSWFDNNSGLCVVGATIVGAAFGVFIGVLGRRLLAGYQCRPRRTR